MSIKDDNSPLTDADTAADVVINKGLREISDYPVISEEIILNGERGRD